MKRRTAILALFSAAMILPGPLLRAEDTAKSVDSLEVLVSKWIEIRRQIELEKRDWSAKESRWQREIDLLKREKAILKKRTDAVGDVASSSAQAQADLLARKQKLAKALADLAPILDRAEAALKPWSKRVPESLGAEVAKLIAQFPANTKEAGRLPVTRRAQVVVALLTQIEQLQNNIHVTRELLPAKNGARREVDVLYLGLGRGFAVSGDGSWAAVGTPGDSGWSWEQQPEQAGKFRKAIQVFNRHVQAEWVTLPLRVTEVTP